MEFHTENSNASEQNQEGSPPLREWSEEFKCYSVNGILAPSPLSELHMEMEVEDKPQAESCGSSPGKIQHSMPKEEDEPECSRPGSSKKKRTVEGDDKFFFKLFKFPKSQSEEYLLEMHKVETSEVYRSHLIVHEGTSKWKIGVYDLVPGDHVVFPVVEDPSPPRFPPKYLLPLQERLNRWTVERRKRGNGKEDKFYYHGGRQFRSFVEVTAFLLYSTKLKDLKTVTPTELPEQDVSLMEVDVGTISDSTQLG